MGCGSSSLKGEAPNDPNSDVMPPAKRVQTNFSEIDFDRGAAPDRRGTMAVAPHERARAGKVSSEIDAAEPRTPTRPEASAEKAHQHQEDGIKLQPYKSIDGAEGGSNELNTLNKDVGNTDDIQVAGKQHNAEATLASTIVNDPSTTVKA